MANDQFNFDDLTHKQKRFCEEYVIDWNGTRAYKVAYPDASEEAARAAASRLLTNVNIQLYIEFIQKDLAKLCGISAAMVVNEAKKIAFTSIAHLHNTWIERKDFETLTSDQKDSIAEIQTRVLKRNIGTASEPDIVDVEEVKIKLFDKLKGMEIINKMLGFNSPEKIEIDPGQKSSSTFGSISDFLLDNKNKTP